MRKTQRVLGVLLALYLVATLLVATGVRADSGKTTLVIHYHRFNGDYEGWNLWIWVPGREGSSCQFDQRDSYGMKAVVDLEGSHPRLGFIVRKGNWEAKDTPDDRFVDIRGGLAEIWLVQDDRRVYSTRPDPRPGMRATLDGEDLLTVRLAAPAKPAGTEFEGFRVTCDGEEQEIASVERVVATSAAATARASLFRIRTARPLSPLETYAVAKEGYREAAVTNGAVLDGPNYVYDGDDLGATYTKEATTLKVWAPTALEVNVLLYMSATGASVERIPMARQAKGVWQASLPGDHQGQYYVYEARHAAATVTVPDPYSRASAANSTRTLIFDPAVTNPEGWDRDAPVSLATPVDAVIYEAHVRDMTIHPTSGVEPAWRGKYLGLAQEGTRGPEGVTTGLDHLKELGITHVHLLPVYDFGSADETDPNSRNWGYDPVLYNVPEGCYATNPDGVERILEFKRMVQALHRSGIGVVVDVVYNHTHATGLADRISVFDKLVPDYFYRFDDAGNRAAASGCGNEVASERPMVRKFILDSVKYWTREFHLDGMRFDLMALTDKDTMLLVEKAAREINPHFLMYGEPWLVGSSPLPAEQQITKGNQKGTRLAVFNDNLRNAMKGPWDDNTKGGFMNGVRGREKAIRDGVEGSINDFAASPEEVVQYVTCHDGMTLWDRVSTSNPSDSVEDRVKMTLLGNAIVFTAQGIPFMQEGEEFLRTKGFNANSYNADDTVNAIDWSFKARNRQVFEYYRGLVALRKAHPSFRLNSAEEVRRSLSFFLVGSNMVAFKLTNDRDTWKEIVVIYNGNKGEKTIRLPEGSWVAVVAGMEAGVTPVTAMPNCYAAEVTVPGYSAMVLYEGEFPEGFTRRQAGM
ncbi:MAG: type I pullulanase [Bacillota bacterium]